MLGSIKSRKIKDQLLFFFFRIVFKYYAKSLEKETNDPSELNPSALRIDEIDPSQLDPSQLD